MKRKSIHWLKRKRREFINKANTMKKHNVINHQYATLCSEIKLINSFLNEDSDYGL